MNLSDKPYEYLLHRIKQLEAENAVLREDLARISEELGLPPTIGPAPGELRRIMAVNKEDAERYRWMRTAGAWDSEIGMNILSETPDKFDAAIDEARKHAKNNP